MSDPIRIRTESGEDKVYITPDIARQIVALSGEVAAAYALYDIHCDGHDDGERRIKEMENRIVALEQWAKRDADMVAQAVADLEDKPTTVAADKPDQTATRKCPACGEPVLHRWSNGLNAWLPIQYHDCNLPMPADQPAGDDAAVGDSPKRMRSYAAALTYNGTRVEGSAKHLLLWGASKIDAQAKEIADLRAKLDTSEKYCAFYSNQAQRMMAERDKALARVAELERERDAANRVAADRIDDAGRYRIVADKALADLAAERTVHVNTGARCAALEHTLAAARAKCDALKALLRESVACFNGLYLEQQRMRERIDAALGEKPNAGISGQPSSAAPLHDLVGCEPLTGEKP